MAPSVAEIPTATVDTVTKNVAKLAVSAVPNASLEGKHDDGPSYPYYYPHYDLNEKWEPLEVREFSDPGLRANPAKPNLLNENAKLRHLSPYIGTEIQGVQISQLSKEGLDELALLTAERKVLVFRNQDFKDLGPERQIEIASHFGPIHRHPTSGNVKGFPEFHVVYRDPSHDHFKEYIGGDRINLTSWHSDVSYEKQPPGTTFFFILDQPETGGDTLFASQVEAYSRLSDEFKKRLEGLRVVHSAVRQAEFSRRIGGPVRREPIETEHPIVRVHPVTGEKALYINQGFARRIVGLKQEESDFLLKFLFDHIAKGADFQIRASYEPGTVVVWDNRVTVHSATPDFSPTFRRHAVRLTPQAEVPTAPASP
ncbi:alpha-ketoglutarate catabolism dioxygenase [Coprinopsis cinerea okayama7|uniref:Alpha-ketoglutarate catabolism dioxygenase n=1 Tax=Coprinopsis cinerea (strain Okayama-7 / 130 / ATCC MYA-4618 / FGSC 9003) TaxID=240176 RepID=A8NLK3_COPC7|nr:alpha-ketoglutarate catabolism dioxygenase [Coprinopsis cinerea okayama7\|eukprot:XP_001834709.1 alpha-ketoglutarate catabolism dioxygenase [Coprinopsis cinerea okayama7\